MENESNLSVATSVAPCQQCETLRERVRLFKQKSSTEFAAAWDLHEVVDHVLARLPEGDHRLRLTRALDAFEAAVEEATTAFRRDWDAHKDRWNVEVLARCYYCCSVLSDGEMASQRFMDDPATVPISPAALVSTVDLNARPAVGLRICDACRSSDQK